MSQQLYDRKLLPRAMLVALLPLLALAGVQAAAAEEGCSGTLCDLYYGKTSSFDDKPAAPQAPTPMMVPRLFGGAGQQPAGASGGTAAATGQPARRPLVGVGGGGLAAMARGEDQGQCTGTLCDLFYHKSSSFDDPPPQQAGAASTAPAATAVAAEEAPPAQALRMEGFQSRPEPPRCAARSRDPWSCYR